MSLLKRPLFCCLLGFAACFCFFPGKPLAQSEAPAPVIQSDDRDPLLRQLMAEVRQLRLALQHSAQLNTRFQLAIERMRIQQGHVDALARELAGVRSELSGLEAAQSSAVERQRDAEEELRQATDTERDGLVEEMKRTKQASASIEKESQARREREAELVVRLQREEAKLEGLDDELEALAKELKEQ